MAEHVTDAIVAHCIDFRFQKYLDLWLMGRFGHDNYDRVSLEVVFTIFIPSWNRWKSRTGYTRSRK